MFSQRWLLLFNAVSSVTCLKHAVGVYRFIVGYRLSKYRNIETILELLFIHQMGH